MSCTSVECPGRADCADGAECFAERARDRAQDASILVVNHALYCAHLAADGRVLPEHDVVILDEAHAFADNATNAFAGDIAARRARAPRGHARPGRRRRGGGRRADASRARRSAKVIESRERRGRRRRRRRARRRARRGRRTARGGERQARHSRRRLRQAHRAARDGPARGVAPARRARRRRRRVGRARSGAAGGSASRRSRPGDRSGTLLLDRRPVIAVSATLGGEPPFPAVAFQMGLATDARAGCVGRARRRRATGPRTRAAATRRCRRRRRSTGRTQGLLYVGQGPARPGRERATPGSRRRAIACASS